MIGRYVCFDGTSSFFRASFTTTSAFFYHLSIVARSQRNKLEKNLYNRSCALSLSLSSVLLSQKLRARGGGACLTDFHTLGAKCWLPYSPLLPGEVYPPLHYRNQAQACCFNSKKAPARRRFLPHSDRRSDPCWLVRKWTSR